MKFHAGRRHNAGLVKRLSVWANRFRPRWYSKGGQSLSLLFLVAVVPVLLFLPKCAQETSRPNVALITMDTLRADHVGCYGYEQNTTPNIDKFAGQSIVFKNSVAVMPTTLPAHTSIMTSLYPFEHGVRANGWKHESPHITLAEILKKNGYETASFVSVWGIGRGKSLSRGFDLFEESTHFNKGEYNTERRAEATTALALDWLRDRKEKEVPFFLWVHYYDPHSDYDPPEPFRSMFSQNHEDGRFDGTTNSLYEIMKTDVTVAPEESAHMISLYDAEVRYMDEQIGKLLDRLQEFRNVMVVLVADHGEGFGEHGSWLHAYDIYEENTRIPLIVKLPSGSGAGAVIEEQAEQVDILPTILDYLSIENPVVSSGRSLKAMIERQEAPVGLGVIERQRMSKSFAEKCNLKSGNLIGIRRWPWKFIFNDTGDFELYNLEKDPTEQNDVSAEHGELVQSLSQEAREYLEKIKGTKEPEMDEETKKKLKALGYL